MGVWSTSSTRSSDSVPLIAAQPLSAAALPPGLRLLCQLLVAAFLVLVEKLFFTFGDILPVWLAQALTLLGMVWMVNLYNFMDGMDGFASGMAIFAFAALALERDRGDREELRDRIGRGGDRGMRSLRGDARKRHVFQK